ncbi:MAG TPA: tetratricopeptide repeat protein [Vicinamibacteria bacterium]|jgi:tetratricopeptide (TPR) repeat protein|nr:tetratricopeptide repeat protein [Vicinamibacteria bacterium]
MAGGIGCAKLVEEYRHGDRQPAITETIDRTVIAYAKLVEEYRHGDSNRAIAEVIDWKPEAVLDAIQEVEKAERPPLAGGPARDVLASFPAAVMLHTEAGLYLNYRRGVGPNQWPLAMRLAELKPVTSEQGAFLRAWYHAFGLYLLGSYLHPEAFALLGRGLQRFPDDVSIALALGQASESIGTVPRKGELVFVRPDPSKERKFPLRAAEDIYRSLLARDPLLGEAKLRLGRVLALTGRADLALGELRVVATGNDARLRYLAHLFSGDILRRGSRLVDARPEFRQALDAWPGGQAAALGLAETLHSLGERAKAASGLTAAIQDNGDSVRSDPFRSYSVGDEAEQRQLLEMVKAMARK